MTQGQCVKGFGAGELFLVMVIDLTLLRLKPVSEVSQLTLLPTIDSSGSTRVTLYDILKSI